MYYWEETGKLVPARTALGYPYYTKEQLDQFLKGWQPRHAVLS
jgi:DNA-binding transcriptional MerR regulator